jgi:hypothetical protein
LTEKAEAYDDAQASNGLIKHPVKALEAMKLYYSGGQKIALLNAFDLLITHWSNAHDEADEKTSAHKITLPAWIIEGIIIELAQSLAKGEDLGKGCLPNTKKQFEKNQEHLQRYLAVDAELSKAKKAGEQLTLIQAIQAAKASNEKLSPTVGSDAFKKSYIKVKNELHDPQTFWKYYPVSDRMGKLIACAQSKLHDQGTENK